MAQLKINDALNKVYLRQKPLTEHFNHFCEQLDILKNALEISKEKKESEEHIKNLIIKFLQDSFYAKTNLVNTKERIDCAIYETLDSSSPVQVLIETKRPGSTEFPSLKNLNSKAMQETVLYYMRERVQNKNLDLKHIVITDGFQWFMFEAADFEKYFRDNKDLQKHYNDFEINPTLFSEKTSTFYNEIASPIIDKVKTDLPFVYFDIRNLTDQRKISVYKLLSPQHLLRRFVCNDSNELNAPFYNELLYIIGLEEVADGNKRKICRLKPADRNRASIIENAINQIEDTVIGEERQFEIALSLAITWINRILFLKLLEAQLVNYHKGDAAYRFLNSTRIGGFDDLHELFFKVLAVPTKDRKPEVAEKYRLIPYLNSSLFEMAENEDKFKISGLRDDAMPVHNQTILYDNRNSKRLKGELKVLDYLFRFLDAYDFGSEPDDDSLTRDNRKSIINASVLGLIFEKINGYKDGSFFTPGVITQYMCRESLRRAVVQKFNDAKGWNCQTFGELADKDLDKTEANQIINSLRICDPAVGSGHFLVSALNELIAIKADLKVLLQTDGKRLKYGVSVENDELMIDDDGEPFVYNPKNAESRMVQESLFAEKRAIIENCLFGVDINPNSVNICRLRLWIELLKNAYYKQDGEFETLPNIDINIKCGNSLVSRYPVKIGDSIGSGDSLSAEIKNYKACVKSYKYENDKAEKQKVKDAIKKVKEKIVPNIQFKLELDASYAAENREAMENSIYRNSMEWMIEFPEVLDDEGRFNGFDVVIGNPPYVSVRTKNFDPTLKPILKANYTLAVGQYDLYTLFIEQANMLLQSNGVLSFIVPTRMLSNENFMMARQFVMNNMPLIHYVNAQKTFESANVEANIMVCQKGLLKPNVSAMVLNNKTDEFSPIATIEFDSILHMPFNIFPFVFTQETLNVLFHIQSNKDAKKLSDYMEITRGFECGYNDNAIGIGTIPFIMSESIYSYVLNIGKPMFCSPDFNQPTKYKTKNVFCDVPKFLTKFCSNEIKFALDEVGYCNTNSVYNCELKPNARQCAYYLLGVLNSKLTTFWFNTAFLNIDSIFPHIQKNQLDAIPIPSANSAQQQPIIDAVNKILEEKKQGPKANIEKINECEREIDIRVYKLYDLTLEEAQIIDASVTAEEFEKY